MVFRTSFGAMANHHWMIAFRFGLIHGFGFASMLTDLGLLQDSLLLSLVSFNIGVEPDHSPSSPRSCLLPMCSTTPGPT
ncbi:MAG: HupE/UreJ family protein [Candidatus Nitrospira kreftii]|uniref:HupE/UreJ family protein n=1 Tax=Candidatus Nitrospira kreftii TaxID=2652173 RepID=A0A7S8FH42_9BACT|nr:MAG: HupE/UreJ family protein [Candidatus Nitrospira kreftii]